MLSTTHHLINATLTESDVRRYIANARLEENDDFSHLRILRPSARYPYFVVMTFWHNRTALKRNRPIFPELTAFT